MKRSIIAGNEEIQERRRPAGTVRLAKAALCVDCERISEAAGGRCPRCGSRSLLGLARILNRREVA